MGEWEDIPADVMQIMLHESHRQWTSHLDWVKLTAENEAGIRTLCVDRARSRRAVDDDALLGREARDRTINLCLEQSR